MRTNQNTEYLTARETAKMLGYKLNYLYKLTQRGNFIEVHRSIFRLPMMRKLNYLGVFIVLLSKATAKEKTITINGKEVFLKIGDCVSSQKGIARRFNISISSVNNILKTLKRENLIDYKSTAKYTIFTVK